MEYELTIKKTINLREELAVKEIVGLLEKIADYQVNYVLTPKIVTKDRIIDKGHTG
jgi:hypothetical protein